MRYLTTLSIVLAAMVAFGQTSPKETPKKNHRGIASAKQVIAPPIYNTYGNRSSEDTGDRGYEIRMGRFEFRKGPRMAWLVNQ